jgi:single-stranded-DNA-specific exonuclease
MRSLALSERKYSAIKAHDLAAAGADPLLARLWAARGVTHVRCDLAPLDALTNVRAAADLIAKHVLTGRIVVVADYDADGATGCAVMLRTLRAFGADCGYAVPSRFKHGYGLSEALADEIKSTMEPTLLVTVDNGIASVAGVARAHDLGMAVVVTDHHLAGETLPAAEVIVNPNQPGCGFPSKALAGCGVAWYVARALVERLSEQGVDPIDPGFSLDGLLPFVALGTVADVVPLDANNRELVARGLALIRDGRVPPGIPALALVSGKLPSRLAVSDFGFAIGPRLNAAGRMETMDAGIECLLAEDPEYAKALAKELNGLNLKRREAEAAVVVDAIDDATQAVDGGRRTIAVYHPEWHEGVVGIAAGRLKERHWRPTFVFTKAEDGGLKGSGRSIPGLHLRDALVEIERRCPGLLIKFGGHAMAAGATIRGDGFELFRETFEAVASAVLSDADLQQVVEHDGSLSPRFYTIDSADAIGREVWGQAFPEPLFLDDFVVKETKPMGKDGAHLRLTLERQGTDYEGVKFFVDGAGPLPGERIRALYRIDANRFMGRPPSLQLRIEHLI